MFYFYIYYKLEIDGKVFCYTDELKDYKSPFPFLEDVFKSCRRLKKEKECFLKSI